MLSHWSGVERQESLQIQGFGDLHHADSTTCCPIRAEGFEQFHNVAPQPRARPHHAREPREAVLPSRDVAEVAQEHVHQEPRPDLPLDRVLVVADEVADLAGLLELLEERLDPPPRPVQLRDRPSAPLHVVREEGHLEHLAVVLHLRCDAAEDAAVAGVRLRRPRHGRLHDLVLQDAHPRLGPLPGLGLLDRTRRDDLQLDVPLPPHDVEHAAHCKRTQELEVGVRPVRDEDVPAFQVRRRRLRAHGVVVRRLLHDGEGRKPVAEVEVHVELRGGLLPPVPRPVEAVGRQLYSGRVECVYGALLEAREKAPVLARRELRAQSLEVVEHPPEHELGHLRVAPAVGVRERVAVRNLRPAHPPPLALEGRRRVAHAVQGLRPRELLVDQRQKMAPRGERPREYLGLRGRFEYDLRGDQLDYLLPDCVYCLRCHWWREHKFFHDSCSLQETAAGGNPLPQNPRPSSGNISSCRHINGMVVVLFISWRICCRSLILFSHTLPIFTPWHRTSILPKSGSFDRFDESNCPGQKKME